MDSIELVLRSDQGVRDMAALYAALNDWYENIRPERKGVRACERVTRIRDDFRVNTELLIIREADIQPLNPVLV